MQPIPFLELSNLVVTFLLFLKVAAIDQELKATEAIEYTGSPAIQMMAELKP